MSDPSIAGYQYAELGRTGAFLAPLPPTPPATPAAPDRLFDLLPEPALVLDADGRVTAANDLARQLLGAPDRSLLGGEATRLFRLAPGARETLLDALRQGAAAGAFRLAGAWGRRHDGVEFPCELRATPLPGARAGWLILVRDTHDEELRAAQQRDRAKAAALATLAQGVVNDFNNAIAAVAGAVENARGRLRDDPQQAEAGLAEAIQAVRETARLVRRLRPLAAPDPSDRRSIDPRTLVEEAVRALGRTLPASVRTETQFEHDGWQVLADPTQLADLLVALGQNAGDAMPGGGVLAFSTTRIAAGSGDGRAPTGHDPIEYVRIDVRDTGRGIAPEHLPRIFDPFFTTKQAGAGAGLGLATAYAVMRQHEGGITVESAPGAGTIFRLMLPRTLQPALSVVPGGPATRGSGTVLLVDDDARVRRPLRQALEHQGYEVVEAGDGDEGLDVHHQHRDRIVLAVVDHRMPRMSGWEVLKELKRRRPDLPVVLVSGYAVAEATGAIGGPRPDAFLRKPFELKDLARTVRQLLA
ncbi:MAG: response regulator [Gemmatimonadales bacterium]|nr:response regulator [Gemmatimonadales bacterium]